MRREEGQNYSKYRGVIYGRALYANKYALWSRYANRGGGSWYPKFVRIVNHQGKGGIQTIRTTRPQCSVFQPFSGRGTFDKLLNVWWNLVSQNNTNLRIFTEPSDK